MINSWGAKGRAPGELWEAQGLTLGTNNDIWVAGYQGHNVVQYNEDGVLLQEWNDHNIQPYKFAQTHGAAIGAHGRLYVTDFWNQVVQVFDRYGNFDFMWGERGQGDGQVFNFPRFTAINDAGEIYIDDDHEVRRFDSAGNFLSRSDIISYPGGIDIDSSGNVWVTGRFEHTLRKYTPDLKLLQVFDGSGIPLGFSEPTSVSINPINGNIYVTDKGRHRVLVLDGDGNYLMTWGTVGKEPGKFNNPIGIEIDSRGLVYVSELVTKRIQVFTANGEYLYGWDVPGTSADKVSRLWDISFDGDYFIYGADKTPGQAEVHKWALVPDPATKSAPAYIIGEDLGFYIWRDNNAGDWHLRWSGDSVKTYDFTGTIVSSSGITSYSEYSFESNDFAEVTPSGLSFSGVAGRGEDGLNFSVPAGSQLFFELQINGVSDSALVKYGVNNVNATFLPVSLFSH